jgi:hypothetical protein
VNNFYFKLPITNLSIQLPIEIQWDFLDRSNAIQAFERDVVTQIIGSPEDFEIVRFAHNDLDPTIIPANTKTDVNYEFYFYNTGATNPITGNSSPNDWINSYITEGFNSAEIYYYTKPFTNSFFKLDFYDTSDPKTQINYFTIIVPVQQGFTTASTISPATAIVQIKYPKFKLDYVGDKEGFFIYWLRSRSFIDIDTFYMTAKFFDAKIGVFVKMMNTPQAALPPTSRFNFDGSSYFYNKVVLDYDIKTYQVFDRNNQRIGTENRPIKWYEYINR